ncbi:MAG: tRNA (cytidine(34)-2'-O)-methyltransferase [Eubacteriaceae bacterium]|nr:tRNA (cytidine(34)-2'-O)-methyltransferase [Eubacteriaceae bacterium]
MFNIVLYTPQIPQNTGSIARTCAVSGSALHLIRPYGFIISDKFVKRAGLDYWDDLSIYEYSDFDEFMEKNGDKSIWLFTSKGQKYYHEASYSDGDFLLFGSETAGVPETVHRAFSGREVKLPMAEGERCLNLANCVCAAVYEALRQTGFKGMV